MSSQKGEFIIVGSAHDYLCMSTAVLLEETIFLVHALSLIARVNNSESLIKVSKFVSVEASKVV